jgi:alkanesulfonate monooxygenase SsuD/methylene tetrahydromethanopterin reductase-like flavin-dependent oxidoreductase (luciferase family)
MKFSIIYEAQLTDTSRDSEFRLFQDMVEQVKLAEKLGFDNVWAVEHHSLTQYAHMSSSETFLAFIAGQTERIGIGHGVVCVPPKMNHPIKVAERIGMLDILSKGRVHFGIGKGGTQTEAGAFGYDDLAELGEAVEEATYLIPKIMTQDFVEHHGKHVTIPGRGVWPKPFQQPHPPIYMACSREDSLRVAGSRGIGALVMGFSGPEEIARKNLLYREAFAGRKAEDQVGFRPTEHLAALCATIVLDDREKARRIGLRGQRFFIQAINHFYAGGPAPVVDDLSAEDHFAAIQDDRAAMISHLGDEKIELTPAQLADLDASQYGVELDAYGTVENATRYVQRLIDAGADEILFLMQMGTVPNDAIMETIRNIGTHLIPHFRDQARTRETASVNA